MYLFGLFTFSICSPRSHAYPGWRAYEQYSDCTGCQPRTPISCSRAFSWNGNRNRQWPCETRKCETPPLLHSRYPLSLYLCKPLSSAHASIRPRGHRTCLAHRLRPGRSSHSPFLPTSSSFASFPEVFFVNPFELTLCTSL